MENLDANTIYTIGLPIAFGLILLEALFSAWKNKVYYHSGDSRP